MIVKNKALSENRSIVRFAGDSGDGMQLLGDLWVKSCGSAKNDLRTVPDFPAEIRAPAGTLAGVSSFQIQFGNQEIVTPGDRLDVLVALNPAALKVNLCDLKPEGLLIVNNANFNELSLTKAAYIKNPLEDGSLSDYRILSIDMNGILRTALKESPLGARDIQKCKNFFCLGLLYWLYSRDISQEIKFIEEKFSKNTLLKEANERALLSGYRYGENTELMQVSLAHKTSLSKGTYRALTGNKALALGLVTASQKANIPLFYASYPITPASDILHELSSLGPGFAHTFQMEDEMAAICAGIGASYAGNLSVTATSGPGFALKAEALGYAVMVELPLIVIDVQRAGPSTGMPTKTEQSDLMQAIYGRSGDAPLPVLAPFSAEDCFLAAIDAARIAIKFMTPVVILSDAFIANSSVPWRVVNPDDIAPITANHAPMGSPFHVYERDKKSLARSWVVPGTKDLMHHIGGLEKNPQGKVSYDPDNHQKMADLRTQKVEQIKEQIPVPKLFPSEGEVLLIGFGGSFGPLREATQELRNQGYAVSHLHLRLLNPLHDELKTIMQGFKTIIVVEQNQGQLLKLLRAQFLVDAKPLNKISGKPFLVQEITSFVLPFFKQEPRSSIAEVTL